MQSSKLEMCSDFLFILTLFRHQYYSPMPFAHILLYTHKNTSHINRHDVGCLIRIDRRLLQSWFGCDSFPVVRQFDTELSFFCQLLLFAQSNGSLLPSSAHICNACCPCRSCSNSACKETLLLFFESLIKRRKYKIAAKTNLTRILLKSMTLKTGTASHKHVGSTGSNKYKDIISARISFSD